MQKKFLICFGLLMMCLSGCYQKNETDQINQFIEQETEIINLDQSVTIIQKLIETGQLSTVLEEASQEDVAKMIKNVSPAQLAFEAEVVNSTLSVLVYFFASNSDTHNQMMPIIEQLAQEYKDKMKVVIIDANSLYAIPQYFEVDEIPTYSLFEDGRECMRTYGVMDKNTLLEGINKWGL